MDHRTSKDLLRVAAARKTFRTPEGGVVTPLDDVSITIRNNEFLTLLGPSGCGKTTLLKAIAGFEDLDGGEIFLGDQPMGDVPPHRRPFNTVFQNYALFPHMRWGRTSATGWRCAGVKRVSARSGWRTCSSSSASRASNAAGRRSCLAGSSSAWRLPRALVNRPRLLLLDEPLSALDRRLRQQMQIELKNGAACGRHHLPVRHPRPGRGADHVGPDRGDEQGPDHADRHAVGNLRHAGQPLRRGASSERATF